MCGGGRCGWRVAGTRSNWGAAMRKHSVLSWLGFLYILLIAVWLILRALFFDRFWPLAVVNTMAEYLFLPLPVLFAAGLWKHRWRLLIGLGLPIAAFGALFGVLFLPASTNPQADQGQLVTAMTFNVLTTNRDSAAIVRAIRAAAPDIIGLQELTQGKKAALSAAFESDYPYHTFVSLDQRSRSPYRPCTTPSM
jgi:vancomycin resistance protein VanJ